MASKFVFLSPAKNLVLFCVLFVLGTGSYLAFLWWCLIDPDARISCHCTALSKTRRWTALA